MDSQIAAVSQISELAMRGVAAAIRTDPRFVAVRARLGERFYDVATAAIRGALKRELVDGAADRRAELEVAGGFAARTILASVVAMAVSAILAAGELAPGARARAFGRVEVEVVEVLERNLDGRTPVLCRRTDSGAECLPFADEVEVLG